MTDRYVCIHGHFYQPPRENPWLEALELQDSAYPYHDWNERVAAECYAPNTASRILDPDRRIVDIVNNYSKINFNFGPTLLSWMEKHKPEIYRAILEVDRLSTQRFSGHGSALAQAYSHLIMPLATLRDKTTQVAWGIRDFQKRFGRSPEGMWLPETAVDTETLVVLADFGIKFTILAPRQAKRVRRMTRGARWHDVSGGRIDPTTVYLCPLPSKKTINLFFYDGPISQDVAFGGLLTSGEQFAERLLSAFDDHRDWPQIVHIATDGETYGHHQRFGDMALAYCLHHIESQDLARVTNYGEYLEKHPPTHWVEIFDNSSWSCVHGVERWRENCGCHSGVHPGWSQAWRRPLREAMDWLRDALLPLYEDGTKGYLKHPWKARDGYIDVVLDRTIEIVEGFFEKHGVKALTREEKSKALKYLEMQRNAMLMFTSCGWFFDEISGIETTQVLQYAARAIQLAEELSGASVEEDYLRMLWKSRSNLPEFENGAKVYEMFVKPAAVDLLRVGAHYGISSLFEEYPKSARIHCYTADSEVYEKVEAGRLKLAIGKTHLRSEITWDEEPVSFAVLHLGDHNLNGGVTKFVSDEAFAAMKGEVKEAFHKGDTSEVIRLMDRHFGMNHYSSRHLFKDEQRKILSRILGSVLEGVEISFRKMFEENYPIMSFLQSLNMPFPKPLSTAAEHVLNSDLKKTFEQEDLNLEKFGGLIKEVKRWSVEVDKETIGFVATSWINAAVERLQEQPEEATIYQKLENVLMLLESIPIEPDLWKAQNAYFSIAKTLYRSMKERADRGEDPAQQWIEWFRRVGDRFHVRVT